MESKIDELMNLLIQIQLDVKICNEKLTKMEEVKTGCVTVMHKVNEWSVENYSNNSIIIKFTYNDSFKTLVKDLGGRWVIGKKGWMFSKNDKETICKNIIDNYRDWKFTEIE